MTTFVDEAAWASSDWKWDAYNLTAAPADGGAGGKSPKGRGGSVEPVGGKQGCQVDGCTQEVGGHKDYHARYKICETHLKAAVVQKDGRPNRFCQQCGKFQPVEDFDADKRSCRARLDKHNARRRRQREMATMLRKTGTVDEKLLADKYDLREDEVAPKLARMAKQGFPAREPAGSGGSAAPSGSAGGGTKQSPSVTVSLQPTSGDTAGAPHRGNAAAAVAAAQEEQKVKAVKLLKQATALQQQQQAAAANAAAAGAAQQASIAQQVAALQQQVQQQQQAGAQGIGGPASMVAANMGMLLDDAFLDEVFDPMMEGLTTTGASGAPGQPTAQFLQMNVASAMDLDDISGLESLTQQILASEASRGGLALPSPVDATRLAGGGASATWPVAPMPRQAPVSLSSLPDTPSSSDTMGAAALPPPPYIAAPRMPAPVAIAPPQQASGFSGLLSSALFGGGLQPPPPLPSSQVLRLASGGGYTRVESPSSGRSTGTQLQQGSIGTGSVLDEALNLLSFDSAQVTYVAEDKLVRFSAKLFNCTPAQLPSDLKASLVNMLSCQSMEGYLRPGCVHITVNALMGPEERALLAQSGARAVVERLVAAQPQAFWSERAMLVQLGDKLALVRNGKVVHVLATAHSSLFPRVSALRPLAAQPNSEGSLEVSVWGHNLDGEDDVVLARSKGAYVEVERVGLEADPAWQGLQRLDLRLTGVREAGAVQVEVMRGGYISGSKAMLVTCDRLLISEVRALEAEERATDVDTLLFQLAASEEYAAAAAAGSGQQGRERTPEDLQVLGKSSRRLLSFSVQRKWLAATRTLLGAACADQPAAEAMASVDIMSVGTTGMPLLQLAVRSQRLEVVQALLAWGATHDYVFRSTTPGRRGLTALHLAGLVRDGGAIAAELSEKCSDAVQGWEGARAEDGFKPIDFARSTGLAPQVERFLATKLHEAMSSAQQQQRQLDAAAKEAAAADFASELAAGAKGCGDSEAVAALCQRRKGDTADSPSSSRQPSSKGLLEVPVELAQAIGMQQQLGEEEEDHVATAKAALKARQAEERAQGGLLRFRNPELESKYQAWYSAGQVPVDVAFLVIATLSQGAWIFRWSLDSSWLGIAMVALMALNATMMQMAVLFPSAYIRWREPLCVWSHLVHKLAQTAVTLVPPVGTIFSPTYNPTVALLESSSLAQIHMLSFGMKLRFGTHLAAGAFHFATAVAANEQICAAGFPFIPGAACNALMTVWQAVACYGLPCALVYASEKRSRRIFLETVSD